MWIAILAACAFLAGALTNFLGESREPAEGAVCLAISALLLGFPLFYRRQRQRDDHFVRWLNTNAEQILQKGAEYRGARITGDTVLTRYDAAFSIVLVTMLVPSRFYIVGAEAGRKAAAIFTVASLVCGWWGLPWGPVRTVQALTTNANGGKKTSVRDLLSPAPVRAPSLPSPQRTTSERHV